jgi:hypothetical protein
MTNINRREFLKNLSRYAGSALVGGYMLDSLLFSPSVARASIMAHVMVAKNGTPAENVAKVIDMRFGGIENIIGYDDVVVLNPNGQWPCQGAANCECCMGLIDLILNRPGGFAGEIIFCENTQFQVDTYWNMTASWILERNGPYNFLNMIQYYQNQGHNNVNGIRLWRSADDSSNWPVVTGPQSGQGWVRTTFVSPTGGQTFDIPYPIIRSPYSNKLIDLKNGVYDNGYAGQPALKFIKIPNLNNHGTNAQQDYAGVTSAVKSFLGITEVGSTPHYSMHAYSYANGAYLTGEVVGAWMNTVRKPDFFLTTAEWVGWGSRTSTQATQARTVGLGDDPVSLDYFMCKNVLYPIHPSQPYFNPDYDTANNNTRKTQEGCRSQGYGTTTESEIAGFVFDFNSPSVFRFDIDRKIKAFRDGQASEQEVLDLIEQYNSGG